MGLTMCCGVRLQARMVAIRVATIRGAPTTEPDLAAAVVADLRAQPYQSRRRCCSPSWACSSPGRFAGAVKSLKNLKLISPQPMAAGFFYRSIRTQTLSVGEFLRNSGWGARQVLKTLRGQNDPAARGEFCWPEPCRGGRMESDILVFRHSIGLFLDTL